MVKVWPGLERWPKIYHFFHYLNISKPLPRFVDYIAWPIIYCQLVLSLSQIHLIAKLPSVKAAFKGCDLLIGLVLYLNFIPYQFLGPILTAISIGFALTLLIVYKNETFVMRAGATYTLRVFLHVLCPIFTMFASSVLQQQIENAALNKKFDPFIVITFIGFVIYIILGLITGILFGQPLHPASLKFQFWKFSTHSMYVVVACSIQQLWSLAVKYPKWGAYLVLGITAVGSIAGLLSALELPYFSPTLNIFLVGMNICFGLSTIMFCFLWRWPEYEFEFAIAYLGIILLTLMVSPRIYSVVGMHVLRNLHRGPRDEKFQDLSDDSSVGTDFPKLSAKKSILLLHYLVIAGYPDICEFTMHMAETTEHMGVIVECFRVLVMLESVPAIVWTKVLEIERVDVSAWQRSILCELQYEAVKMIETGEDYGEIYREFNTRKQDIVKSMLSISEAAVDRDVKKLKHALDNYVDLCEDMEFMAKVYITHAPKSLVLLESYYDYLAKLSGNFSEAVKYKLLIDSLRSGALVTIAQEMQSAEMEDRAPQTESELADITPQQLITQQVAKSIKSRAYPRAVVLFLLTIVIWFLGCVLRPSYLVTNGGALQRYVGNAVDFLGLIANTHLQELQYHINQILICNTTLAEDVSNVLRSIKYMDLKFTAVSVAEFDAVVREMEDGTEESAEILKTWFESDTGVTLESLSFMMRSILQQYDRLSDETEHCYSPIVADMLHTNGTRLSNGESKMLDYFARAFENDHQYLRKATIIIGTVVGSCVLVFALALLIFCVAALKRELSLFADVFFRIDGISMALFRDELLKRMNSHPEQSRTRAFTQEANPSDDNYLELEEIELEEDDPLTIPLDLDLGEPIETSESEWKGSGRMNVKKIGGYALTVVILVVLYLGATLCLHLLNVYFRDEATHRSNTLFGHVETVRYLLKNGCNVGYSGLLGDANIDDLVCADVPQYKETCENIAAHQETWVVPNCDMGLALTLSTTMDQVIPVIEHLLTIRLDVVNDVLAWYSITWACVSAFCLVCTILLLSATVLHFRYAKRWFASVRSLLLLVPSRYFSTISTLAELFEFHGSKKTDRNRQVIASSILKHSREAIVYLDHNKIVEAGQAALAVFAYKKEDIIGQDIEFILPTFNQKASAHQDEEVVEFDIDGESSDGRTPKMRCTYIRSDFQTSILLLDDITGKIATKREINQCRAKLDMMLRNLMPPHLTERFLSGQYQVAIEKDEIVLGVISITDVTLTPGRSNHDYLMELIDLLYSTCDRKLGEYPKLSRLIMDNCMYRFVGGMFNEGPIEEAVKEALDFTTKIQVKCNTRLPHFVQRGVKVQGCLSIQKRPIGSIFSKELPMFDAWCPDEDQFRELALGFTDERIIRVTEEVKNYLQDYGVECIQEMEGMFRCPTYIIHIDIDT